MDPENQNTAETYRLCFESSPDFSIDVITAIREGSGCSLFEDPTEKVGCLYHEHDNGQRCGGDREQS